MCTHTVSLSSFSLDLYWQPFSTCPEFYLSVYRQKPKQLLYHYHCNKWILAFNAFLTLGRLTQHTQYLSSKLTVVILPFWCRSHWDLASRVIAAWPPHLRPQLSFPPTSACQALARECSGVDNVIKLFLFVIDKKTIWAGVFVPGKPFQDSLIFVGKAMGL